MVHLSVPVNGRGICVGKKKKNQKKRLLNTKGLVQSDHMVYSHSTSRRSLCIISKGSFISTEWLSFAFPLTPLWYKDTKCSSMNYQSICSMQFWNKDLYKVLLHLPQIILLWEYCSVGSLGNTLWWSLSGKALRVNHCGGRRNQDWKEEWTAMNSDKGLKWSHREPWGCNGPSE